MCKQPPPPQPDPHTVPFVSEVAAPTAAARLLRERFDLELREAGGGILFQNPVDPPPPPSILNIQTWCNTGTV